MSFEKFERDGKVAILYSPGYGAGWYTWNNEHLGLVFDKEIVQAVLADDLKLAADIAARKYKDAYLGGARDLTIAWVDKGDRFEIAEYDGSESVRVFGRHDGLVA